MNWRIDAESEHVKGCSRGESLLLSAFVLGPIVAVAATPAQAAHRGREFRIPTPGSYPNAIVAGADWNPWFAETRLGWVENGAWHELGGESS